MLFFVNEIDNKNNAKVQNYRLCKKDIHFGVNFLVFLKMVISLSLPVRLVISYIVYYENN